MDMSRRLEKRAARWQELRERANDAASALYVATVRMTDAQFKGSDQEIQISIKNVAAAEKQYVRARAMLADFIVKSVTVKL
jgi:hypothetical protein